MFRSRLIIILLAISTLMFALVPPAFGGVKAKPKGMFALKIGLLGSGPVGFEEEIGKWMKENGLAVGIALDYPVTKRLYLGIFADVHSIKIPKDLPFWVNSGKEDTKDLLNFGLSFKMRATEQGRALVFRPGIGFGYAILKDMPYIENTNYWTVCWTNELIYMTTSNVGILAEIGLWSAPSGGNDKYNISAGPMLVFRGGLVF